MKIASPADVRRQSEEQSEGEEDSSSPFHNFHVDETVLGVRYEGDFQFKVPSIGNQILIGSMKARYLPNGAAADPNAAALVEQICYLEVTLEEKPNWWKPMDFYQADLVATVYAEVVRFANKFLGRGKDGEGLSGGDGNEDRDRGNGDDPGALGEGAQPPGKRPKTVISHTKGGSGSGLEEARVPPDAG